MNQCAWDNSVRSGCVTEPEQNEECNKLMSENQYKILSDIASSTFFIDSKQLSNVINVQTELSNISSNDYGNVVITNTLTHKCDPLIDDFDESTVDIIKHTLIPFHCLFLCVVVISDASFLSENEVSKDDRRGSQNISN